jgi:chaperonin GroEL
MPAKPAKHALTVSTRQIALNSGTDGAVVKAMCRGEGDFGFDPARGKHADLVESGIIDATRVVRLALENAVSVASTLLLAEATLKDVPEPGREHVPAEPGM